MDRKEEWEKEWGWGEIVKKLKIHDDKSLFDGHIVRKPFQGVSFKEKNRFLDECRKVLLKEK